MKLKNIFLFVVIVFICSCSKDKIEIVEPPPSEKALIVYQEAMDLMDEGQFFAAAKRFSEAELIMPKFEQSAKASILSSYCYYKINFYDETLDICQELYKNVKGLHVKYPEYREYDKIGVNAHISITPPLPYKFDIHQEGLEKTWSAVTYITPDKNVGTKMYANSSDKSFVKEAEWNPNSTFIFCGVQGKTWHSYESNQNTNRITFNLFIMKYRSKKCFYPLQ